MSWIPAEEFARREVEREWDHCIDARRSSTVMIEGEGLPTKIGIGAPDLPFETWLSIQNRDVPSSGPQYDRVTQVRTGMLLLDTKPLQGRDQTYCGRSGITVRQGILPPDAAVPPGRIEHTEGTLPRQTYAWRVVGSQGRSAILTIGMNLTSHEVADLLTKNMKGEFHVERIDSGAMTAARDPIVPGWKLLLAPTWRPGDVQYLPPEPPRPGR